MPSRHLSPVRVVVIVCWNYQMLTNLVLGAQLGQQASSPRSPEEFLKRSQTLQMLPRYSLRAQPPYPLTPLISHCWSIASLNLMKSWALWHLRTAWSFTQMGTYHQHPRNWPHWARSIYEEFRQNSLKLNHFLPIFVLKGVNSCLLKQGRHPWPFGVNTALMLMLPLQMLQVWSVR